MARRLVAMPILAVVVLAACTPGRQPAARRASPRPSAAAPAAAPTSPPPACAGAPALPTAPPGVSAAGPLWTIGAGLDQPDDLLFKDGELYVGELGPGAVDVLASGLPRRRLPVTIPAAEGMAFIGSTLYVADQRNDRVVAVEGDRLRTLIQLRPVPGRDGVDGIAAAGDQLIVPDSPRGVVDWVDRSGRIVRTVGGFVRPTGAWPLPDGSLLIADEFGNSVVRLAADGSRSYLSRNLPIADDVVADQGSVFVVAPAASGGRLVELSGGAARTVAGRLAAPQGLALDGAGNVYFSESAAGRVDLLIRTFKLVPVAGAPPAGRPLCVDVFRAPGFTGDIRLDGEAGLQVVVQPGAGNQGAVEIHGCPAATPCRLTATSGALVDQMWVRGPG